MVDSFLPRYDRGDKVLHPDNPITIAPQVNEDWLMEMRRQSDQAARRARDVLIEAYRDFNAKFGRGGEPFIERYMMDDAEVALVGMGTMAMPVKVAVRKMRAAGQEGRLRAREVVPPVPDAASCRRRSPACTPWASSIATSASARPSRAACWPTSCVPRCTRRRTGRRSCRSSPVWADAK